MSQVILKHYGKIEKGKVIYYNPMLFISTQKQLEGKEFELILKEKAKRVSHDAHAYYRAGIIGECMENEMFGGWDREEIHEHFVGLFLSEVVVEKAFDKKGNTIHKESIKKRSTSSLSSKEMKEFTENCIRWCAEHDIIIKTSEQYQLNKFK